MSSGLGFYWYYRFAAPSAVSAYLHKETQKVCDDSVKYLTKDLLVSLNNSAIKAKHENFVSRGTLRNLPRNMNFPVAEATAHNGLIAIEVALNASGLTGIIDVSQAAYDDLPIWEIDPSVFQALEEMYEEYKQLH
jgi:hypothetical protein